MAKNDPVDTAARAAPAVEVPEPAPVPAPDVEDLTDYAGEHLKQIVDREAVLLENETLNSIRAHFGHHPAVAEAIAAGAKAADVQKIVKQIGEVAA